MDLSKIKDIVPVGTFFVIICSVVKLITYYKNFNINIIDYITLPEIIFSFTDDIYSFFSIIIIYIMWWIIDDGIELIWKKNLHEQKDELILSGRIFTRNLILIILAFQLIGTLSEIVWGKSVGLTVSLILTYLSIGYVYIKGPSNHPYFKYLGIFIIFFFMTKIAAEKKADSVKNSKEKESVTIEFRNSDIKVDINSIYVGRTSNYIFFYNKINNTSTIYSNSDVMKFSIRK